MKWSRSVVSDSATPWTVSYQDPPSMGFSRQECWSGLPFPSPGDLPNPGIEAGSPALRADALPSEPPRKSPPRGPYLSPNSLKTCGLLGSSRLLIVQLLLLDMIKSSQVMETLLLPCRAHPSSSLPPASHFPLHPLYPSDAYSYLGVECHFLWESFLTFEDCFLRFLCFPWPYYIHPYFSS